MMNCCLTDKNGVQISLRKMWLTAVPANVVAANGVFRFSFPKIISVLCLLDTPFVVSSSYNQLTLLASIIRLDTLLRSVEFGVKELVRSRGCREETPCIQRGKFVMQ